MIAVGESHGHNHIHPKTLFLMEMRELRPIDFVIRIACLEYTVFPLSFLWSILLSVAISLQGGKVVRGLAQHATFCPCRWFKSEHIILIQIHDHISFMALQL